jgi:hypothetical protein
MSRDQYNVSEAINHSGFHPAYTKDGVRETIAKQAAVAVILAIAFATLSPLQDVAADNSTSSTSYPLRISEYSQVVPGCPTDNMCASVNDIVNQSPNDIEGLLYGNASGYGVDGRYVYYANASIAVPAGQNASSQLVFAPPGIEPGLCGLRFDFVVLARNGTQLSNSISFGPGSCGGISNSSLSVQNSTCSKLGSMEVASLTYTSDLNHDLYPTVFGIVRNSAGQTLYYTTEIAGFAINGSSTAYLAIPDLANGIYSEFVFAITQGGVVISPALTLYCPG